MKIIKIKEINWYDALSKSDAVTYKVFLDVKGQTELKWFDTKLELETFVSTLKNKKAKK